MSNMNRIFHEQFEERVRPESIGLVHYKYLLYLLYLLRAGSRVELAHEILKKRTVYLLALYTIVCASQKHPSYFWPVHEYFWLVHTMVYTVSKYTVLFFKISWERVPEISL